MIITYPYIVNFEQIYSLSRLEIERRFLNEYNLVDDGLNINM